MIVSIETGKPKLEAFGKDLVEVGKTLMRISTDTEHVAERFLNFLVVGDSTASSFALMCRRHWMEDIGLESYNRGSSHLLSTNNKCQLWTELAQ